ncbi:MAG: hypothetical protein H7301_10525 [Cryobacterium sp.]|nr:hypothetical protein [Oligoflexia bacterium]
MSRSIKFLGTLLLIGSASLPAVALADGTEAYSFGACPSQGAWTQTALENMRTLYSTISRLKDNPACKGKENTINGIVENFQNAETELKLPANDAFATQVETLPGEINALRQVVPGTGGGLRETMNRLLYKKTLQAAVMGSDQAAIHRDPKDISEDPTSAIRALYKRTDRASQYGMRMVQQIFSALPQLDECIMGQPDVGLAVIGAAVKVGAAFAGSSDSAGYSLGSAMGSLVSMMRDRRFTLAMRQLDEREFWMSISCMLETTTKNYCEAENAQEMLQYAEKQYQRTMKNVRTGLADPDSDNPLEGYYLLSRELPAIANWLSQLKLGTDPRGGADATQQNSAIEKINEFWKMKKTINGDMNIGIQTVLALPDIASRRNGMLELIKLLYYDLTNNKQANYFVYQAKKDIEIPFFLVGMKSPPDAVIAKAGNTRIVTYYDWMSTGGPNQGMQDFFEDPAVLADIIRVQVKSLLQVADDNAASYYRQYLVVDEQNLVMMTLTGQALTVRESMVHVVRYLERLEKRLSRSDADLAMLPIVKETEMRVKAILDSYGKIMAIGRDYRNGKIRIDASSSAVEEASKIIIDTVYDQFNVLYQSDVFLTNRLTSFIQRDFSMRLRSGLDLSQHQREIMFITQDHLIQRLLQNFGQNMTMAKSDLASAQVLNRSSLYSFEEVFSDQIFLMLEELNQVVHTKDASPAALAELAEKRYARDRKTLRAGAVPIFLPMTPSIPIFQSWRKFVDFLIPGFSLKREHPDLYIRPLNSRRVTGGDTRFGDYDRFRSMLCAQTLSFQDRARFAPLCMDSVVTSAYSHESADELGNLDLRYADYWQTHSTPNQIASYALKVKRDSRKTSKRICAYNNFSIRNWVRMLQDRDSREDSAQTEGEYDYERQEREAKAPAAAETLRLEKERVEAAAKTGLLIAPNVEKTAPIQVGSSPRRTGRATAPGTPPPALPPVTPAKPIDSAPPFGR